jgi:hypothetical protein
MFTEEASMVRRAQSRTRIELEIDGEVWRCVESLRRSGPDDSHFVLATNEDGSATMTFGDGKRGRRLPTGSSSVIATYRPSRKRIAILMQQGRVILDADWNEGNGT